MNEARWRKIWLLLASVFILYAFSRPAIADWDHTWSDCQSSGNNAWVLDVDQSDCAGTGTDACLDGKHFASQLQHWGGTGTCQGDYLPGNHCSDASLPPYPAPQYRLKAACTAVRLGCVNPNAPTGTTTGVTVAVTQCADDQNPPDKFPVQPDKPPNQWLIVTH